MGTRSLTHVKDDVWEEGQESKTLVTIYRQFDGYPSGMGADLLRFLKGRTIVNGLTPGITSNGMGELAAQLVTALKTDSPDGNVYLYPPDDSGVGEEYTYTITNAAVRNGSLLTLKCVDYRGKTLFDAPVNEIDLSKFD